MYFKVAIVTFSVIAFSACGNPFGPKPHNPNSNNKKLGVKVVEVIDEAPAVVSDNKEVETITPIGQSPIKENTPRKKKKPYLKPEPYSLESHENDPELLGPQTTLDTPLVRANDDTDSNTTN